MKITTKVYKGYTFRKVQFSSGRTLVLSYYAKRKVGTGQHIYAANKVFSGTISHYRRDGLRQHEYTHKTWLEIN